MRNKKKSQISVLLLILLGLSIGFAALATTLKINGTTIITKNTWNVYWDNIGNEDGVTPTSITIDDESESNKDNIVNFSVTLDKPGDYFEFTVDAVNAGTIDAEVLTIEKKYNDTLIPEVEDPNNRVVPAYLKYEVKYADGTEITAGDKLLKANGNTPTTRTVKVRVEYDRNAVTNSDINNQSGTVSHSFSFSVQYGQATSSEGGDDSDIAARIAEIEADPDEFRDPQQDIRNTDIGLDENGNVINLDWWTDYNTYDDYNDLPYLRDYSKRIIRDAEKAPLGVLDEIVLGVYPDDPTTSEINTGIETIATASENVVDGECIAPIPAYIMLSETGEFYPVTEIAYAFGSYGTYEKNEISKLPHLPKTVTRIGDSAFWYLGTFENVVIPKQIEYIGFAAFQDSFVYEEGNSLTFEEGSRLKEIEDWGFWRNRIQGDLVLPASVTSIGSRAFLENDFTSISIPSSATYDDGSVEDPTFDDNVTLIRY